MRRLAASLIALLALAACGNRTPREPEDPVVAECRRETRDAPEMRAVFRRQPPSDDGSWLQNELRVAQQPLIRACLERNVPTGFGVQPRQR